MTASAKEPDSRENVPNRRRHFRIGVILVAVAVVGAAAGPRVLMNMHPVSEGMVYRSAQLDADQLREIIAEYGIRSILNLRGEKTGEEWYDAEVAVARETGVAHMSHKLSARREVPPDELDAIVRMIEKAPKPILIHCQGGADRTSLVAAAWKLRTDGVSPEVAGEQLSLKYFHFPYLFWSNTEAMDASFEDFIAHIAAENAKTAPKQPQTTSEPPLSAAAN